MQNKTEQMRTVWDPMQVFNCSPDYKYAVIILNRPIYWNHDTVLKLWKEAQVTITVDGGTHRWLRYLEEKQIHLLDGENTCYIPDLITGDMDSCCHVLIEKLKTMGSTIIETPNQNLTDYTKALLQLAQYVKMENITLNAIYVFAETSGRFDHIVGNVNTLYKSDKYVGDVQVIQIASNSLTWLLKPGLHSIMVPEILVQKNSWCGLLPFGSTVKQISTTGLKWNLTDATMQIGGLISSSNTYENSKEVTVNTDTPVIWSMGIEPLVGYLHNDEDL